MAELLAPVAERTLERRSFRLTDVRVVQRRAADGTTSDVAEVEGYASVYDHAYNVAGGPPYGWEEIIARGAAKNTIAANCRTKLLINHGGYGLAYTRSGTLELEDTKTGLRILASLDLRQARATDLRFALERGDIDEMSMAFWVERQEWNGDYTKRSIAEIDLDQGDVSIVDFGANDATSVDLRSDRRLVELRRAQGIDIPLEVQLRLGLGAPTAPPAAALPVGGLTLSAAKKIAGTK